MSQPLDLDTLLDAALPEGQPSADFDVAFEARWAAAQAAEVAAVDALLTAVEAAPSASFDAGFEARWAAAQAAEVAAVDALLAAAPTPSAAFDAGFEARWAAAQAAELAAVNRLLDADQPTPSPAFDGRVAERLPAPGARVLPFSPRARRLWVGALVALAAAAAFVWVRPTVPVDEPPPEELAMLGYLDLLEAYDEVEVLDALEDPEVFALVAALDQVAPEAEGLP